MVRNIERLLYVTDTIGDTHKEFPETSQASISDSNSEIYTCILCIPKNI